MRGKVAEPVGPPVVCSHCGRAGGPDEQGEFCGENFCRGVLQAQPEPELPPVVEQPPVPPKRVPRREKDREGLAKAFLFVAVVVLVVAVVVLWPSDDDGEPVAGEPVSTATASLAEGQMGEEGKPPESRMPAEEKPAGNPGLKMDEPKAKADGEMGMADTGAAKDHTRSLRQSAHQHANGYLAWSYGVWRSPPGLFAAGKDGAAYARVDRASGWAGEPGERPEITEFEARRKSRNVASAHVVAGPHVLNLVLQRHTSGTMRNWLQIPVTDHMRPIWRVTTVVDASA